MKTKIVVITGHPDTQSFCAALADAYSANAVASGAEVRRIDLGKLAFDPNLKFGYGKRTELEEGLVAAQESIRWAEHLVIVYPTWWGTMPAVLKGFFDRVLLPGFAFKYRQDSPLWDKLLSGKSARLIVTSDTQVWYDRLVYGRAGIRVMKNNILRFCGIKPVKVTSIGPIRGSTPERRAVWLAQAKKLGAGKL